MAKDNKKSGDEGEELAARILSEKNYEIVERNYRYGHGEIDIIARDGETLVFIEVKTRKNLQYGMPEYAVTQTKQRQIKKIAEAYLYENNITDTDCRMDVVAILFKKGEKPYINHLINAF